MRFCNEICTFNASSSLISRNCAFCNIEYIISFASQTLSILDILHDLILIITLTHIQTLTVTLTLPNYNTTLTATLTITLTLTANPNIHCEHKHKP